VIGIDHENLTANPLRLGNSSRVVMGERGAEPLGDRPHWPARRATRPLAGSVASLLSVHRYLIVQPAITYPPLREERGEAGWRKMPRYLDENGCSG
jgi:hypothetical protein